MPKEQPSYQNIFFSFMLEPLLEMAKEINKEDIESTYARVTKHTSKTVAKAEIDLN